MFTTFDEVSEEPKINAKVQKVLHEFKDNDTGLSSRKNAIEKLISTAENNNDETLEKAIAVFTEIEKLLQVALTTDVEHPRLHLEFFLGAIDHAYKAFSVNPLDENIEKDLAREAEHTSIRAKWSHESNSLFGKLTRCELEKEIKEVITEKVIAPSC